MLDEATFWQFAVDLYGKSDVSQVCIELQDKLGLNVNLLLLLCWCERQKIQLDGEQIQQLNFGLDRWHQQYTKPLRQLRRQLALEDDADETVKKTIFEAEMALEKTEQRLLLGVFNQFSLNPQNNAQNLQRYVSQADSKAVIDYAGQIERLRAMI